MGVHRGAKQKDGSFFQQVVSLKKKKNATRYQWIALLQMVVVVGGKRGVVCDIDRAA